MSRKRLLCILPACLVLMFAVTLGCSPQQSTDTGSGDGTSTAEATAVSEESPVNGLSAVSGFPTDGRFVDNLTWLNDYPGSEEVEANAAANQPRRYVDRNGFTVQPVPADDIGYNITYLDADHRGCTSCHTLEDALMSLPTYHRLIFFGYNTEQSYMNCIGCHSESYQPRNHLGDSLHTLHLGSSVFTDAYQGDCQSCHYMTYDGMERWDMAKYNVYHGFTDISADDSGIQVTFDQTTITPRENWFYKTIKDEPSEWLLDDSTTDQSIFDNWTISIDGDCNNPVEMTLPELEERFGTVKQTMKMDCTVNGVGMATIMQVEVEGIPVSAIIDYAQPKDGANILSPISSDGYDYAQMGIDWLIDNDALIVTRMNGEPLANSQGYPCMIWVYKTSGGNFVKRISNLTFMTVPEDEVNSQLYVGQFLDDTTGIVYSKPNSAVLNYPTGVVLSGDEANPVHLEGFADAWDEPIARIEYSLDHGETWTTIETPDNDARYWTYWQLDFQPPQTGSYLLNIRTTSITPEGTERVCQYDTQFMFTVE